MNTKKPTNSSTGSFLWLMILIFVTAVILDSCTPYDPTDNAVAGERSGMRYYVDHGTGCEYLSTLFGNLLPRLDANGEHVCNGGRQ